MTTDYMELRAAASPESIALGGKVFVSPTAIAALLTAYDALVAAKGVSVACEVSGDDVRCCPVGSIVDLYHELMPNNPRVKVLNETRKKAIRKRWKEAAALNCKPFGYATKSAGMAAWRAFFEVCAQSDFLIGRGATRPGFVKFVADIDFIFSPSGFAKILENKYHREAA